MSKFKVGDTVMVRYWDDMAREYGVNSNGAICVPRYFVRDMQNLCGKTAEIKEIEPNGRHIKLSDVPKWKFSEEMLVLVEAAEEELDTEIKVCPLCGGKAKTCTGKHDMFERSLFIEHVIRCDDCGLMLKRATKIRYENGVAAVIHDGYAEAVAAWNRRADAGKTL